MLKLAFYDPQPFKNDYASKMYIQPLMGYARYRGIPTQGTDRLIPEAGWSMVCNADFLTPEVVKHFKECDCPIYGINCIDSAYPSEILRGPHIFDVTKLFMVSGVQNTNFSEATVIDPDFTIRTERRQFLPDPEWAIFDIMRKAGRIVSLPYVPWGRFPEVPVIPFENKRATVIFRGGNHLLRYVAYLFALRNNCADPESGFQAKAYFAEDMVEQFRFCEDCRLTYMSNHGYYPYGLTGLTEDCSSEAKWGDKLDMEVPGLWNNRCPQSFYWLAEQFQKRYGALDFKCIERALNHTTQHDRAHLTSISHARFYAENKWEFSINMPQRFWEGASVGSINLLPERVNDQDYFPQMKPGRDYLTFHNDLSGIHANRPHCEEIANNARELYLRWIKPTDWPISTGLLESLISHLEY